MNFFFRLVLFAALVFLTQACANEQETVKPEVSTLTESVYASITIQPDSLYQVYSAVGGIIDKVFVEDGDLLDKHQPLVQITNTSPRLSVENARLALDQARNNLEGPNNIIFGLKKEVQSAQLKMENDSVNFIKQRNLWKKNIGTQNAFESRELAYRTSLNNLRLLVNQLERTENELRTQLETAQNNYETAVTNNRDYTVKSKINGRVYELLKEPGEIVSLQQPIARVGSNSMFVIEMLIDEVDITRIDMNQEVIITLDAYPDQVFEAKVSKIYPSKDNSTQTFTVEAVFKNPPERLYAGLSGEANIVISRKDNALIIPLKYLTSENQVNTDDGLVTVEVGLINLDKVEILSGIDAETNLYLPKK